MYDFILFENLYDVENHYKDLNNLAYLLHKAGYKVAIADVFKEEIFCQVDGIPHIKLRKRVSGKFANPSKSYKRSNPIVNLYWRFKHDLYLIYIIRHLSGLSKNVYLGTLSMGIPFLFFSTFKKHTKYFIWGLRTAHALHWKNKKKTELSYWISKIIFRSITQIPNLFLIVSNKIIRNEYIENVGVAAKRIIVRPERFIQEPNVPLGDSHKDELHLLSFGTLRPSKHLELCLDALKSMNDISIHYTIAGRCKNNVEYENLLHRHSNGVHNIHRINRYISDDEYEELMNNCDFFVLCDEPELSCATNGTMSEALLRGIPIIAPNHNPFCDEIIKHGVGILYDFNSVVSLSEAIVTAKKDSREKYLSALLDYQKDYLEKNVVELLKKQLDDIV